MCVCVCVCVCQVGGEGKGQESGEFNVSGNTKLKIKRRLSFRWFCCNPDDIKPLSSVRPSIHPTHTLPRLSSTSSDHLTRVTLTKGWLPPPRAPSRRAHLQVCEGRSQMKADCVLIKFIICGELILKGNLSPLVLKESWITHLL